jgi:hypothetical protein
MKKSKIESTKSCLKVLLDLEKPSLKIANEAERALECLQPLDHMEISSGDLVASLPDGHHAAGNDDDNGSDDDSEKGSDESNEELFGHNEEHEELDPQLNLEVAGPHE